MCSGNEHTRAGIFSRFSEHMPCLHPLRLFIKAFQKFHALVQTKIHQEE